MVVEVGFTDHGSLSGLGDDDHMQYHTDARGDLRYSLLAHIHAASAITYSNTTSGLAATTVQAAIDEVVLNTGPTISGYYRFDTDTTATDPGSGDLKYNSATPASVTSIYVSQTSRPGTDAARLFALLSSGMILLVQQQRIPRSTCKRPSPVAHRQWRVVDDPGHSHRQRHVAYECNAAQFHLAWRRWNRRRRRWRHGNAITTVRSMSRSSTFSSRQVSTH